MEQFDHTKRSSSRKKTRRTRQKAPSLLARTLYLINMDKKGHKYIVIFIAIFVLLRLIVYLLGEPSQQMSIVYDAMLYSTLLLLLTLGPLYKHRLIYLYLSVVTIVFIGFIAVGIDEIINASNASDIVITLFIFALVSFFTYDVYYKVPFILFLKHNKTLYVKLKALKNRTNRCPNCKADLTRDFSKIDEKIDDGYICPHCNVKLGFKRFHTILSYLSLGLLYLWGMTLLLEVSCTFFEFMCTSYDDKYYLVPTAFVLTLVLSLNLKQMYVMKTHGNKKI